MATIPYDTVTVNKAISFETPQLFQQPDTAFANNPSLLLSNMLENGEISAKCSNYLTNIFNTFNNDIGTNTPSSTIYNKFANDIIAIENTAKGDNTLSATDLQYTLITASVARNSAAYWGNYQINQSGGGSNEALIKTRSFRPLTRKSSPFSWRKVAGGDAVGAITGMYAGAVVGAMAGGIGSGPGAISGAAGGAIIGSMGSALSQIFGW